jgi:F-type H+-transporting ATPase subunit gamma
MASNLKAIRVRIGSVRKTQKITRAMKVVSAAKLARAQHAIQAARPYAAKLRQVLGSVAAGVDADAHPLLARREVRRLDVVLFTSDRGLCGAFNTNVIKRAQQLIAERRAGLERMTLIGVGRRGAEFFRKRGFDVIRSWTGLATPTPEHAAEIAALLMARYLGGETDQVALVYGEFRSAMTQAPRAELLLPFTPEDAPAGATTRAYAVEPSPEELLALILPRAVEFGVFRALLETAASEHGARMSAMDSATSNCAELIRSLTLDMNKARQAAITQELSEIVGGAEAL